MRFWGVEVKGGEPLKVEPGEDSLIHLSQAALGESKKDKGEPVMIFAKVGDQKIVLGTLSSDKFPQISFDVVFGKEFELSHNSKNGSVHFIGYQAHGNEYPSDSSEDEDIPLMNAADNVAAVNAKPKTNVEPPPKASKEEPKETDESDDDDDDDEDEDNGTSDSDGAEYVSEDDEDADSESEDEENPKKVESAKKRPAGDSAIKTPALSKKQKTAAPQKTDDKKNVHIATPHPAKKPAPKSGGQFSCKSCDRSFVSDFALQSHSKAKHDK